MIPASPSAEPRPPSFLDGIDARAILLASFAFILAVISVPKFDPAGVIALAALPAFLVVAARLPARRILRRIFLLSPFVCLVAAANPFLDRRPMALLDTFTVGAGTISAAVIAAKAMVSLLAVLTLMEATPFYRICEALRRLGVPEAFTTQLILLYRYAALLADEAASLQRARDLRSFHRHGRGIPVTARLIGTLLLRATARSERVYLAMLARGFSGTLAHSPERPFQARDAAFLAIALALCVILRVIP